MSKKKVVVALGHEALGSTILEQLDAVKQTVSMLVIDKGRIRLKDAGFPPIVLENTPKYLRRSKVPVVKAKVGPKVMTFISDAAIFDRIPVKKEVKAVVSGLYITGVKGLRGSNEPVETKKKGLWARAKAMAEEKTKEKEKEKK